MRVIKFRAWSLKKKLMLGVDTLEFLNGGIKFGDGCTTEGWVTANEGFEKECHPTIKLMQFTGLHDKNGVEIYEGDICMIGSKKGVIQFQEGAFFWNVQTIFALKRTLKCDFKIIGNIYENGDLINEK